MYRRLEKVAVRIEVDNKVGLDGLKKVGNKWMIEKKRRW